VLAPIPTVLPAIRSGDLIALGISTNKRSRPIPDVPNIAEAGTPGSDFPIWYGVWAPPPAGTPPDVVVKVSSEVTRALASPKLQDWMADHSANPMTMTQLELTHFAERKSKRDIRVVKAGNHIVP